MSNRKKTIALCVDGSTINCHVHGRGPLCVVYPGEAEPGWEHARIPLAERELAMVYVEPAGADDPVERLRAVVEHFGDEPVFVIGHGRGGFAAQRYAICDPAGVAGLILYSTSPVAECSDLSHITAPTLVLAGAHDDPEEAAALAAGIPRSRIVTFEQSGHLAHLEESERFVHILLEFTRRVSGPVRTGRR
ncbi:alpha/beta fold hydrolase [Actinoplanes rectilineatus]|uniref:alpha/beta fold hydrolase n=1 Tax=Actinoplanes rectilineatus TaxID=113571 RepID=UPI0012FAA90D|nr:alpha/beta hydrolase [Actinoplanes rectilineatus]